MHHLVEESEYPDVLAVTKTVVQNDLIAELITDTVFQSPSYLGEPNYGVRWIWQAIAKVLAIEGAE